MSPEEWQVEQEKKDRDNDAQVRYLIEANEIRPAPLSRFIKEHETKTPIELQSHRKAAAKIIIRLFEAHKNWSIEGGAGWRAVKIGGYALGWIAGKRGSWATTVDPTKPIVDALHSGTFPTQYLAVASLISRAFKLKLTAWKAVDQLLNSAGDWVLEAEEALAKLSPAQGEKLCLRWIRLCQKRGTMRAKL